jgi:co-chaperonin GroES (HSP10)
MPGTENENIIYVGQAGFEAFFNRVIVRQDEWRSGYECGRCGGKDIRNECSYILCDNCNGSGKSLIVKDGKCSICDGRGIVICPDCKGKGATLVTPDSAKNRPTTGTIVSVGENVQHFKIGDKVIYPSFAGHGYDLGGITSEGKPVSAFCVILRDDEILCRMYGTLEQRAVKKSLALHTVA